MLAKFALLEAIEPRRLVSVVTGGGIYFTGDGLLKTTNALVALNTASGNPDIASKANATGSTTASATTAATATRTT